MSKREEAFSKIEKFGMRGEFLKNCEVSEKGIITFFFNEKGRETSEENSGIVKHLGDNSLEGVINGLKSLSKNKVLLVTELIDFFDFLGGDVVSKTMESLSTLQGEDLEDEIGFIDNYLNEIIELIEMGSEIKEANYPF